MPPYVSDVKQKTYLKVSEEGSEAAAASLVEISILIDGGGTPVRSMSVDRPFLYAIHDRCTGAILFIGQINDPPPISEEMISPCRSPHGPLAALAMDPVRLHLHLRK